MGRMILKKQTFCKKVFTTAVFYGRIYSESKKTTTMKTEEKTDYDKFLEERNAAHLLRDELFWLVGYMDSRDDVVVREKLKKALKEHDENRCQSWL